MDLSSIDYFNFFDFTFFGSSGTHTLNGLSGHIESFLLTFKTSWKTNFFFIRKTIRVQFFYTYIHALIIYIN
jgi:hypothetical protein